MRVLCKIKGRVQGVSFRYWTQQTANELRLAGWVRNEADGSVSALFDGEERAVKAMLEQCHHGPKAARVSEVQTSEPGDAQASAPGTFDILR